MKKRLISTLMLLMLFTQQAYASILGNTIVGWSHEIGNGTQIYKNTFMSEQEGVGKQVEYYAEYVPNDDVVPSVVNGNSLWGLKKIDKIEEYMKENEMVPLLGINASYFSWETGLPMGHVISDGKIMSKDTLAYDSIGFTKSGSAFIAPLSIETTLTAGENVIDIAHINKYNQTITDVINLYTTDFDDNNHTSSPSLNIILGDIDGELSLDDSLTAVVEEKFNYSSSIKIPEDKIVLTLNESGLPELYEALNSLKIGDEVTISSKTLTENELWKTADSALGSVGETLIKDGEIQGDFPSGAAPRTAVGITDAGNVIFYVIDGRQKPYSYGARVETLAKRMKELGCVDAINLDGGGSTVISGIYPGSDVSSVFNSPSEGKLRACSNYIFLKNTQNPTNKLNKLYLYPFERHYLSGFSEEISVKAVDTAYYKVDTPENLKFSVNATKSTIDETGILTASGTEKFSVEVTDGKVSGTANYYTYESPTDIIVRDENNKEITELTLKKGDKVKFNLTAMYNNIELLSSDNCFEFEVVNELGIIENNELIITSDGGEGTLKVIAGEYVKEIPLKVEYEYIFTDISEHWAREMIKNASIKGIISGYQSENGLLFKPDNNMTREEFAAVVCRLLNINTEEYIDRSLDEFEDSQEISEWARPYVAAIFSYGLITGKLNQGEIYFAPKDTLTRAEAITILGRTITNSEEQSTQINEDVSAVKYEEITNHNDNMINKSHMFADNDEIPEWAKEYVDLLVFKGIVNGYEDNTIRPKGLVTRAEAVTIITGMPSFNLT